MATPQIIDTRGNSRIQRMIITSPRSEWKLLSNPAGKTYILNIIAFGNDPVHIQLESKVFHQLRVPLIQSTNGVFIQLSYPICIAQDDEVIMRVFSSSQVEIEVKLRSDEWFQAPIDTSNTLNYEDNRF